MNPYNLDPRNMTAEFTLSYAPRFRARVRPENYATHSVAFEKLAKRKNLPERFTPNKKPRNFAIDALVKMDNTVQGPGALRLSKASEMDRLVLVRKVAECPYSETPFWARAWQIACHRDGLHIWQVDRTDAEEDILSESRIAE